MDGLMLELYMMNISLSILISLHSVYYIIIYIYTHIFILQKKQQVTPANHVAGSETLQIKLFCTVSH